MNFSVWQDPAAFVPAPLPESVSRAQTVVVGAGLTGLSVALHLLERGREVVVLERDFPGAGASGRSTGMLTPGVGQSLPALIRRLGPENAGRLYRQSLDAVDYAIDLLVREKIDCQWHAGGQLVVARGKRGRARLAAQARAFRELGLPCEMLDDAALARRVRLGDPAPGNGPAALFLANAGILHPGLLVQGLAQRVTERGGRIIYPARVAALWANPLRLELAGGGSVQADEIVLASGPYTPEVGVLRGRVLPVQLQALATEPLSAEELKEIGWAGRECVIDTRRLFDYFRLTEDKRIVFGGGRPALALSGTLSLPKGLSNGYARGQADTASPAALERALRRVFPGLEARVAAHWHGVIDYTLDNLMILGQPSPGVFYVGGWCGHGIALGLAAGNWLAQRMVDGAWPQDAPRLRARPPLLPGEPLRRLGFWAGVSALAVLDRW